MRTDLAKLYNALTNPPDPHGQDFANVCSWMKAQGLPDNVKAQIVAQEVGYPGGHYTDTNIVFARPGDPAQPFSFSLFMNSPGLTLLVLKQLYHFGDEGKNPNLVDYTPPIVPAPEPPPAPPVTCPVGASQGFADCYWPVPGDHSPNGATWSDSRGSFVCVESNTPFGESRYWKKVG